MAKKVTTATGAIEYLCAKCGVSYARRENADMCCCAGDVGTIHTFELDPNWRSNDPGHAAKMDAIMEHQMQEIKPGGIVSVDTTTNIATGEAFAELFTDPEAMGTAQAATELPDVKAPELLGRAAMHTHDRASTYDSPGGERSMGKAVAAFNAVTGRDLSESEGWLLLALLKQARLFTRSAYHADSAEDAIAYMALLAEARAAGR